MSIFEDFLSTSEAVTAFSGHSVVAAMLRFEAALAQAQADEGLVPPAAARSIVDTCRVELFDVRGCADEPVLHHQQRVDRLIDAGGTERVAGQ